MKNSDISVLSQDLFKLLGMEDADVSEQDSFLNSFLNTVSTYFFQEKLSPLLTPAEKDAMAEKYVNVDKESIYEMLTELSNKIENIEELYTSALAEAKAKVVKNFYEDKCSILEEMINNETDDEIKAILQKKLEGCNRNLKFALTGRYDQIVNIY